MTHDETCQFDKTLCRDCLLQAEARKSEREYAAFRVTKIKNVFKINGGLLVDWNKAIAAARGGEQA